MSLINQMLQDLDARRAAHGVGNRLPSDVRPLPPAPKSRWPVVLGVVVVAVLGGAYALLQWRSGQETVSPPAEVPVAGPALVAETATVAVPPLPAPLSESPPELETVAEPVAQPDPPPAEVVALQAQAGDPEVSLRMADSIAPAVAEKKPVANATAVRVPVPTAPKVAESESVRRKAVAPADPAQPPTTPVQVDRAVSAGTPAREPLIQKSEPVSTPRQRLEADFGRAVATLNQGRVEQAVDDLRAVLAQDALHVASRQLLVKLLLEANRRDEAVQVLRDGLQSQPAQLGWAMTLARLQVDGGDLAGAWQTLDHSMPAADGIADYRGFAAHVLQRLGRNKEAAFHFQAAARLAPGDGRWWLGLGLAYEAEGQSTEAREAFMRARSGGNLSAELMALVEQKLR